MDQKGASIQRMEERKIKMGNRITSYFIQYKKIKNCYLKVEQGQIVVHAPQMMNIDQIEALIIQNQDKLLKRMDQYFCKADYVDQGYVYLFNQKYRILLKEVGIKKCAIHGLDLYVYHRDIEKTVTLFLKEQLMDYLVRKIQTYLLNDFPLNKVDITLRKMKSRWGACFYKKNKICFNSVLVHVDKKLIDYVIVHELCHFIEPNHSKEFYLEIEKRMPDYKQREKRLAEVGI